MGRVSDFVSVMVLAGGLAGCTAFSRNVTQTPVEASPALLARPDRYQTTQNVALYVADPTGVLANDLCHEPILSFPKRTRRGGIVRGYSLGSFFYTPPSGFEGKDGFAYSILQGSQSSTADVEIQVVPNKRTALSIDLYKGSWNFQLVLPGDSREFESYLQAQVKGGALQGKTKILQADALPGTRFASMLERDAWNSSVARDYACQIAAQCLGYNPLDPESIHRAAQEYHSMNAECQLFLQVAAVFKGDLLGGPGSYDNEGLKKLLEARGLSEFITSNKVGQTDVNTLGAVAKAMNAGQLTILDIINSGTFEDVRRYDQVVEYVYSGKFRETVAKYESATI